MSTESRSSFSGRVLAGGLESMAGHRSYPFFDDRVIDFFDECARKIRKSKEASEFKDLLTFAFFCRGAALRQAASGYHVITERLGWGLSIHVAPSNVPVNLAYTLLFGLLSGNKCLIRASSKEYKQLSIFFDILKSVGSLSGYSEVYHRLCIIECAYDDPVWLSFLETADARVIWGGDDTVDQVRRIRSQARAIELVFPDRQSLCVLSASAIASLSPDELQKLAVKFFHDTLLIDQNACSSPVHILWLDSEGREATVDRFWKIVSSAEIELGPLGVKKYIDKLTRVGRIIGRSVVPQIREYGLGVTVVNSGITSAHDVRLGCYVEEKIDSVASVLDFTNHKTQTVTYYGIDPAEIKACVIESGCQGIDRIVPVGDALDIGFQWDGKDILTTLSRRIALK